MVADQGSTITDVEINQLVLPPEFENEAWEGPIDWQVVNGFLATFTQEELETVCCGEPEDQAPLLRKGGDEIGQHVNGALECLFVAIGG